MKNSKVILSILGILVLIGGLGAGLYSVRQRQNLVQQAAAATTLRFQTIPNPTVGDDFDIEVSMATNDNQVIGVELYLTFDSTRLQANSVSPGTIWGGLGQVQNSTIGDGTISYVIFLPPPPTGVPVGPNASGPVASLNFTALAPGDALIGFAATTIVAGVGGEDTGTNVLDIATPTTLSIQSATASPTPTQDPGQVPPTNTPTNTPTATPTNSPTATLSPTPTTGGTGGGGTATNTPTPTTGSSATNTPTPTSTGSGSSSKKLAITSLTVGQVLTDNTPTFRGTAPVGNTISLTVESDPVSGTTTADASGNWSWTVPAANALDDGSHTVTASSGGDTVSVNFTVDTSGTLPDAGVSTPTLIGFGLGLIVLLLAAGLFAL